MPMFGYVAEPFYARWFELHVRVEAARYGAAGGGLLLLVQERDELTLSFNISLNLMIREIEIMNDSVLLRNRWEWHLELQEHVWIEPQPTINDARGNHFEEVFIKRRSEKVVQKARVVSGGSTIHAIRWACDSGHRRGPQTAVPRKHDVYNDISWRHELVTNEARGSGKHIIAVRNAFAASRHARVLRDR